VPREVAWVWRDSQALLAAAVSQAAAERERGYAEALDAGRRESAVLVAEAAAARDGYLESVEEEVTDLVLQSVRRVFLAAFDERERVAVLVRKALSAMRGEKEMTLQVHPDEVAGIRQDLGDILRDFPSVSFVEVVPDKRVECGNCILISRIGIVALNVDTQIDTLREAFGGYGAAS
jgi:type III secretion protein L